MHVLITGGAGFIGSHLVEYHLNKNDTVHAIDDLSTGVESNVTLFKGNPNYQFTNADLLTMPNLKECISKANRIYHMAAVVGVFKVINDSEKLLAVNIAATERLLRAAKETGQNPRILLASTSEVYGDCHSIPAKESSVIILGSGKKNCTSYVVSKIALEYFGLSYHQHYDLPVTLLRIFNMIGPRQIGGYGMVVPRFVTSAVKNESIVVYGTGKQTRSFCDIRDAVILMDKIAESNPLIGEIINVGQDQEISINALAKLVKDLSHSSAEITHVPYDAIYGEGFEDFMSRKPDMSKLEKYVPHQFQWDLERTLLDLIERQRRG